MRLAVRFENETPIFLLYGPFDCTAKREFQWILETGKVVQTSHIILDMTHVPLVDSAGIGRLSVAQDNLKQNGVTLSVVNPQKSVRGVFDITRLSKYLPIYGSVQDALEDVLAVSV